ncbi:alpha-galactosidase [Pseudonocardia hydrocarbonoxydans]|uniref:alpha-galactosidase n=1 Tax=Pseudonocardia hydrocarbonoxydans TaxID=76726 RepID=A0A4Y3WQ60_9PSEU|nr:alpha-galactosidase [Pseudonocardia hydrocarbonoxydans]
MRLRAGGVGLLLDVSPDALPRVLHWGADVPGDDPAATAAALVPAVAHSALDEPWPLTVLPGAADGWPGRPAVRGHRAGRGAFPRWSVSGVAVDGPELAVTAAAEGLALDLRLSLEPSGVLVVRVALRNDGATPYVLDGLTPLLPLPGHARELLDLTGRWCRENSPQRSPLHVGIRSRESWRGRPGHDGTPLLVAGTPGFGFGHGEVWAVHVAWSGDAEHVVERVPEGVTVLGGGELVRPLVLAPGASYDAPPLVAAWSDSGLDGLSARLHAYVRARASHPRTPRPLTCNTWEAVYFDHDPARLTDLADRAAAVGVERFVLDDGWFRGRRDDTTALGDWTVDPSVWPDGLHPLVDHVRGLGMQFGLWVEPEMVSPDSDLARAHPDWLLAAPGRIPRSWRHQQVLDLARPEAFAHVLDALDALVGTYDLDALKWDHNRDLHEPVHDGVPGTHAQTHALYRLLDELRARHPRCEIESCASGGARADLGILARTDRVWASDTTDPVERQSIQRWTGLLLPPELVGTHVGAPVSHTTGRASGLPLRLVSSLFGHAGIEWDLTAVPPEDLARLRAWAGLHKELRGLLHTGRTVRADDPGEGLVLHGVVGPRGAVYAYLRLHSGADAVPPRLRLPGLDPARRYHLRLRPEAGELRPSFAVRQPAWLDTGVELTGGVLGRVGVAAPLLAPGQAVVLHVEPR